MRAAATLHGCHLFGIPNVADIENTHATETIRAGRRQLTGVRATGAPGLGGRWWWRCWRST